MFKTSIAAALVFVVCGAASVPPDLGGETGPRILKVHARHTSGKEWRMPFVYGSSGTLNLWLAWGPNTKGCITKQSRWAFHRPAPTAKALAALAAGGMTETDLVRVYGQFYPPNLRKMFYAQITSKGAPVWFTGSTLAAMDHEVRLCR